MHRLLNLLTISCREVTRLGSESRERPLSWREKLALRLHFRLCWICSFWEPQVRAIEETFRQHDEAAERDLTPEGGLSETCKDALRHRLREADGPQPGD